MNAVEKLEIASIMESISNEYLGIDLSDPQSLGAILGVSS